MVQYVSIIEASHLTGLSVSALRQGVRSGRFPYIRVGDILRGKLLFDLQQLAQILADEAYSSMSSNRYSL